MKTRPAPSALFLATLCAAVCWGVARTAPCAPLPFGIESVEIAKPWDAEWHELLWTSVLLQGDDLRIVVRFSDRTPPPSGLAESLSAAIRTFSVDPDGRTNILKTLAVRVTDRNSTIGPHNELRVTVPAAALSAAGIGSREEDDHGAEFCSAESSTLAAPPPGKSGRQDSDQFDSDQLAHGGLRRGLARGRGDVRASPPEGEFSQSFIKAAGVVCFDVEMAGARSQVRQIQEQCDIFYFSGHGRYAHNCLYATELSEPFFGDMLHPRDVSGHWEDVDIVIVASCSVLDIGDFNNNFRGNRSPGKKWAETGAEWYLGYNYLSPADSQDGDQQAMSAIVQGWHSRVVSGADVIDAWRDANLEAVNPKGKLIGSNACAIHVPLKGDQKVYAYFRKRFRDKPVWTRVPESNWP